MVSRCWLGLVSIWLSCLNVSISCLSIGSDVTIYTIVLFIIYTVDVAVLYIGSSPGGGLGGGLMPFPVGADQTPLHNNPFTSTDGLWGVVSGTFLFLF